MADGSILGNAKRSAAHAQSCSKDGCPNCEKNGFPVLLTIPTLVSKAYGDKHAKGSDLLLKGLALPQLQYSGYGVRGLREGYVMVWYEKPPASVPHEDHWTIARVHEGGYMTATTFAAEGVGGKPSSPLKKKRLFP